MARPRETLDTRTKIIFDWFSSRLFSTSGMDVVAREEGISPGGSPYRLLILPESDPSAYIKMFCSPSTVTLSYSRSYALSALEARRKDSFVDAALAIADRRQIGHDKDNPSLEETRFYDARIGLHMSIGYTRYSGNNVGFMTGGDAKKFLRFALVLKVVDDMMEMAR